MNQPTVLVVDDDPKILFAFREVLRTEGYKSLTAKNGQDALRKISTKHPSVIFLDVTMPEVDGLEVLKRMKEYKESAPVIIITGYGTMQTAIKAMQLGAFEYLTKPLDVAKIREVTLKALASTQRAKISEHQSLYVGDMVEPYELVGNSPPMQEVYKLIGSISTTPNHTSVTILGESGTGKELVARTIHKTSFNAGQPFVPINCTALPEPLLESELFGHEKGAFTGAVDRKLGKFEIAHGGTIFLDEIGNLSPQLQQKLLRVLQEREFDRLGGNGLIHVDARFIAATNRDITTEVEKGNFREDLFFRLKVVTVNLPPLRERREDIPLLANYFLKKYNEQLKKYIKGFSNEAITLLQRHSYPGNVRELENVIERAVMLTKGEVILPDSLTEPLPSTSHHAVLLPITSQTFSRSRTDILNMFERQFVSELLAKHRGNVTAAARSSRMTRQNFQRLMTKHHLLARKYRS
ncbi:MAG: sigma-54-dependent Fis family transcriptional regulator [Ignavibacteriales bacterium]|nr:sigma-54-dependent Fis family transcriptional regulator [Ignavibacteriales bacterium]